MRYTVVCECSFDDVNGEYATYALAWVKQDNRKKLLVYRSQLVNGLFAEMEEALEEYTGTPAYAQRVADALNGQDVSPEHVYNVLDNFYGMGEAAPVTRRWWE